jgi:uncharacterized protein YyaL (SSP411 family)
VLAQQVAPASAENSEIPWLRSATEAAKLSQSTGKPILVYIRSQNCHYCDLLQKNTWQNPETRAQIMRDMIPLKLTLEDNKAAVEAMKVKGFPSVIIFSPKREYLARIDGYVTPEQFKTKVTEKVERVLAPSEPLQLAAFETKLVERRFEEAEKLDKKQLLVKEDTKNKARKEIEKQAEKAEKAIAKARISKQIEVAQDTMMMQSFSTTQNDSKEDDEVDIRKSKRGKSDDHRDDRNEQDSELEKVFKKHSNIVKKLDIKKNNRSYDDK